MSQLQKALAVIFFLIISELGLKAQDSSSVESPSLQIVSYGQWGGGKKKNYNNQVKISAGRLIDPINTGLELGYQRHYAENYATQVSAAYLFNIFNLSGSYEMRGFRLALEQKFFFFQRKRVGMYVGIELAFLKNYSTPILPFKDPKDTFAYSHTVYQDTVTVHKQTVTGNARFGLELSIKHFVMDFSVGLGVKYIDTKYSGQLIPGDVPSYHYINIQRFTSWPGKRYVLNIPCTVRIGCTF